MFIDFDELFKLPLRTQLLIIIGAILGFGGGFTLVLALSLDQIAISVVGLVFWIVGLVLVKIA